MGNALYTCKCNTHVLTSILSNFTCVCVQEREYTPQVIAGPSWCRPPRECMSRYAYYLKCSLRATISLLCVVTLGYFHSCFECRYLILCAGLYKWIHHQPNAPDSFHVTVLFAMGALVIYICTYSTTSWRVCACACLRVCLCVSECSVCVRVCVCVRMRLVKIGVGSVSLS